jgi:hypothetical protein
LAQIQGSGLGDYSNVAIVDNNKRLWANSEIVGSGGYYYHDSSSRAMPSIEYEHHEIHDGNHYHTRGWNIIASSGGSLCFYMETSNGSKWTHLVFDIYSDNLVEWKEYDFAVASGAGSIVAYNSNLNSTNKYSGSIITSPLSVSEQGVLTAEGFIGAAGANPSQRGLTGDYGRNNEIILKSGTGYLWVFRAGGNNTKLGWDAEWYEHTDRIKKW